MSGTPLLAQRLRDMLDTASLSFDDRLLIQRSSDTIEALVGALEAVVDSHEMLFHPKDRHRQANKAQQVGVARVAMARARGES
jgi:hypothetical protein